METKVKIKIKSRRRETSQSLFESMINACEDGTQFDEVEEMLDSDGVQSDETLEMFTEGVLRESENRVELVYNESELTGMEGSITTVSFEKDAPQLVSMMRGGSVSTVLIFEPGKRHICAYNTPFMPFEICVHTLSTDNSLLSSGELYLDYMIEIRGATAERTRFALSISRDECDIPKEN